MKRMRHFLSLLILALILNSCDDEELRPRPFAYFRIDLAEPVYSVSELDCPFEFEYSDQARLIVKDAQKCWVNIYYPKHKATIYLTYSDIDGDLAEQLRQTQDLTYEHQIKANKIDRILHENPENNTHGLRYRLGGDVASNVQFYLTDSSDHFLRGALYFNCPVNADSLRPVVEYMDKDIQHLIATLKWN